MSAWSTTLPTAVGWYWIRRLVDGVEVERTIVYVGGVVDGLAVWRAGVVGCLFIHDYAGREWQAVQGAQS